MQRLFGSEFRCGRLDRGGRGIYNDVSAARFVPLLLLLFARGAPDTSAPFSEGPELLESLSIAKAALLAWDSPIRNLIRPTVNCLCSSAMTISYGVGGGNPGQERGFSFVISGGRIALLGLDPSE